MVSEFHRAKFYHAEVSEGNEDELLEERTRKEDAYHISCTQKNTNKQTHKNILK